MESESDKNPLMMFWIYGTFAIFLIVYPSSDMTWWKTLLMSLLWPIVSAAGMLGFGPDQRVCISY